MGVHILSKQKLSHWIVFQRILFYTSMHGFNLGKIIKNPEENISIWPIVWLPNNKEAEDQSDPLIGLREYMSYACWLQFLLRTLVCSLYQEQMAT